MISLRGLFLSCIGNFLQIHHLHMWDNSWWILHNNPRHFTHNNCQRYCTCDLGTVLSRYMNFIQIEPMLPKVTSSGIYHFVITFVMRLLSLLLTGDFMPSQPPFSTSWKSSCYCTSWLEEWISDIKNTPPEKTLTAYSQIDPPDADASQS